MMAPKPAPVPTLTGLGVRTFNDGFPPTMLHKTIPIPVVIITAVVLAVCRIPCTCAYHTFDHGCHDGGVVRSSRRRGAVAREQRTDAIQVPGLAGMVQSRVAFGIAVLQGSTWHGVLWLLQHALKFCFVGGEGTGGAVAAGVVETSFLADKPLLLPRVVVVAAAAAAVVVFVVVELLGIS